jgi:hypothetical protein
MLNEMGIGFQPLLKLYSNEYRVPTTVEAIFNLNLLCCINTASKVVRKLSTRYPFPRSFS